jgi:hypothetical protein
MLERHFDELIWREVVWQRPFELEVVQEMLVHLSSLSTRGPMVWEVRGNGKRVRYLLGVERCHQSKIKQAMEPHGKIQFHKPEEERTPITNAALLKISKATLSLKTDNALAVIRAALAAMNQCRDHEELVLQIALGPAIMPAPLPHNMPDPHASWLDTVLGNVGAASPDSRAAVREKISQQGFNCVIRLGAAAGNSEVGTCARINGLFSALRTLESAGVRLNLKSEDTVKLNGTHVPWSFPLRLSVKELAHFLLLPVGEEDLPGVPGLHPKLCLPPSWYVPPISTKNNRTFAVAMDGKKKLSIAPRDSLEHTHIMGPIGSGKSTVLLNLILDDIKAGRSVLVIDPKADLVNDVLARIPAERDGDVVVLDPSDSCPVGFNPLAYKANPTLVADAVLSVFKEVFSENWGIRSQDVFSAALLTLAQCEGSSLLWLPALLTDASFRHKVTAKIKDRIGLEPFWANFEAMKDTERRMEIAPVLNKIRQFLLRPGLRNVLGQAEPKFRLEDLFNKRRIVLVPLNKGVIGSESAKLLGSLIVSQMWTLTLSRAALPPKQRQLISVYIDELQDYLSLPTDFSDALAQARGLGVGLTLAHQYREQLPPEIRAGVDANARNKIVFGLNISDAKSMAAMAPELEPVDFMSLPRYQVYTSFMSGGKSTGWVQGQTLPAPMETRVAVDLKNKVMNAYGKPAEEVEEEYLAQLGYTAPPDSTAEPLEPIASAPPIAPVAATPVGRKKKVQPTNQPPDKPPD